MKPSGKPNSGIILEPEGTETPQPRWTGGAQLFGRSRFSRDRGDAGRAVRGARLTTAARRCPASPRPGPPARPRSGPAARGCCTQSTSGPAPGRRPRSAGKEREPSGLESSRSFPACQGSARMPPSWKLPTPRACTRQGFPGNESNFVFACTVQDFYWTYSAYLIFIKSAINK